MSFDGFFTPYGARIEGRTLEWSHSKINQPFEQELVLQIRGNRKNQNSCSLPILSLDGFNGPRPTLKILPFPIPLLWSCANIFKALSLKGLSKWKTTGFLKSVSPIKRNWRCHFCQPHDRNHGQAQ